MYKYNSIRCGICKGHGEVSYKGRTIICKTCDALGYINKLDWIMNKIYNYIIPTYSVENLVEDTKKIG